jgi:hypothetical protein
MSAREDYRQAPGRVKLKPQSVSRPSNWSLGRLTEKLREACCSAEATELCYVYAEKPSKKDPEPKNPDDLFTPSPSWPFPPRADIPEGLLPEGMTKEGIYFSKNVPYSMDDEDTMSMTMIDSDEEGVGERADGADSNSAIATARRWSDSPRLAKEAKGSAVQNGSNSS